MTVSFANDMLSGLSSAVNWLCGRLLRTADDRDDDDGQLCQLCLSVCFCLFAVFSVPLLLYFTLVVACFLCPLYKCYCFDNGQPSCLYLCSK